MKFKVDENLPTELTEILSDAGHDAVTILEEKMGGAPDEEIAALCRKEERAIVTLDTDFADLRSYPPAEYPGIVVFRLQRQDKSHVLEVGRRFVAALERERLANRLWIVEEGRIRIRSHEE